MDKNNILKTVAILLFGILFAVVVYSTIQAFNISKEVYLKRQILLEERIKDLSKHLAEQKDKRDAEKDSLVKIITERDIKIVYLKKDNENLEGRIKRVKDKPIVVPETAGEMAQYFNNRYEESQNMEVDGKVSLIESTAAKTIVDLEVKDRLDSVLFYKEKIISNKDSEISILYKNQDNYKTMLNSAEQEILLHEDLNKLATENIKNLNRENKKLINKRKINRIITPIAIVASGFLGYSIAK